MSQDENLYLDRLPEYHNLVFMAAFAIGRDSVFSGGDMSNSDRVLIAGAGPVGLVVAAYLGQRGVPTTVLEAELELGNELRASTVHPPTLEMLDGFGIAEQVIAQGVKAPTWQFRDRQDGPVAVFDLGAIADETIFPFRVQCEQWKISHLLYDRIKEMPSVEFRFGHRAVGVRQSDDAVELEVETAKGVEVVRGRYLVGADGGSSAVRKALGIEFEGFTYPEMFLVVSTPFRFEDVMPGLSYINYVSDPEEWLVLLRVRDFWRVLFPVDPEDSEDELLSDKSIEDRLHGVYAAPEPYDVVHRTLYHIHQRVAERYRVGRAFVAGDAAHLNNPLGGMGMNGGIHDAMSLADKIARVWEGAPEAELDRYERQRRPIALEDVKVQSMRNRAILSETDPETRRQHLDEMRRTAEDPALARAFLLRTSMIESARRSEKLA